MARVPGLTEFEDDRPQRGRPREQRRPPRVDWEGGGIDRMPRLRPQAQPLDMFVRPPAELPADRQLNQLVDSLGSLNTALQRFGASSQQNSERDAEGRIQQARLQNDEAGFQRWVNDPANAAVVRTTAGQAAIGQAAAIRRAQQLREEYQTSFDRDNGDFESFVRERMSADLNGQTPEYARAYSGAITSHVETLRTNHANHRAGRERASVESGLITIYQDSIAGGIQGGATPEQVMEAINARRAADRRFSQIDYNRSAELLLQAAREHAEKNGNREFLDRLLEQPRRFTNANGGVTELPSFATAFPAQVNQIRDAARRRDTETGRLTTTELRQQIGDRADQGQLTEDDTKKLDELQQRGLITQDQNLAYRNRNREFIQRQTQLQEAERLRRGIAEDEDIQRTQIESNAAETIRRDGISGLREATIRKLNRSTGEFETERVSVNQQIENATRTEVANIEKAVRERQITPEEGLNRQVAWFSRTGTTNETWRNAINGAYTNANLATVTANNGQTPPEALRGYELFRTLRAKAPHILDRHVSADARRFFESVDRLRELGQTPEQAFRSVTAMSGRDEASRVASRQKVEQEIARVRQGGFAGFFGSRITNPNDPEVVSTITEYAKEFAETLPPQEALQAARQRFEQTHRIVNGYAVNVNSMNVPQWFENEVNEYVNFYADRDRNDNVERNDIVIRRVPNTDTFRLVHRRNPGFILGSTDGTDGLPPIFNLQQLERFRNERMTRVHTQAAEQANRNNAIQQQRQQGIQQRGTMDGFMPPDPSMWGGGGSN